jgi:sugar phosphate isomerase/epimerase
VGAWAQRLVAQGQRVTFGAVRPTEEAEALRAAGYDFIEGFVGRLLVPDKPEADFAPLAANLKSLAIPVPVCNSFIPAALKVVGAEANHDAAAAYAETAIRRAGTCGIGIIVFGSGGARRIPDGFDTAQAKQQFIAFAKRIAPAAQKANVLLVLEPLNRKETNFINSLAEGAEIVDAVAHPAFRLHADIYHMMQEDEPPSAITAGGPRIAHVHVAQKGTRHAPMPGGSDFRPYFKALKGIGYQGRIAVEAVWQDKVDRFDEIATFLKAQWNEA